MYIFSIYLLRVTLYDYQALCWVYSESSDSGHTLLDVSSAVVHIVELLVCGLKTTCLSDEYFLSFLALLCFLLGCEVDPD